jgi:hypothetical protein
VAAVKSLHVPCSSLQGFARRWVGQNLYVHVPPGTVLGTRPFTEFDSIHAGHFYPGAPILEVSCGYQLRQPDVTIFGHLVMIQD